jgi:cell division protein FtsI/penicillin-binding protein 2
MPSYRLRQMPTSNLTPSIPLRRLATIVTLATLSAACGLFSRQPDPTPAVQNFVENLRRGRVEPTTLVDAGDAEQAERLLTGMGDELGIAPQFPLAGPVEMESAAGTEPRVSASEPAGGDLTDDTRPHATARVRVRWRLPGGTWAYDTTLPLVLIDDRWKVSWRSTVLHPRLADGQSVAVAWSTPKRGPILSRDGEPLFVRRPVVTVYVQPRRVQDLNDVLSVLDTTLQIESDPLRERVEAADPDHLVDVVTLRIEDYAPLRATLHPVPGLVFRKQRRPLTPSRTFARALLGRVAPPTAEILDEIGPGFGPDDILGVSGLQRQFQDSLAGRPGMRVVSVDAEGNEVATLHDTASKAGDALRTTLDPRVQNTADTALSTVGRPSALVAVQASTGEVLAVANGPDGGDIDRALAGQYPPGSTFNVVTAAALLATGMDPGDPVACPSTATVGTRTFRNAEGRAVGRAPFRTAFAQSCDTTMVSLVPQLPEGALMQAGQQFGFDGQWNPGVNAFGGEIPAPNDDAEQAATAIGQAPVLASPLLMASVAAAVADGVWRPPVLLPDHDSPGDGAHPLDPALTAALADLMRDVVTRGTGRALRDVPGRPVHAKTGTAELGQQEPLQADAWVIAYRGDIAIAVLIEDGDSQQAAMVAAEFFGRLANA